MVTLTQEEEENEEEEEEEEGEGGKAKDSDAPLGGLNLIGRGLASTLALLKETGTLKTHKTISGRNNDKKKGKLAVPWDESDIPKDKEYQFNFKLVSTTKSVPRVLLEVP